MKNKCYLSPSLSLRPVTPVAVMFSPAVNLLTLGVTKVILSSWWLAKATMSLGSLPFNFFRFVFGFDGAGGYSYQAVTVVCACVHVCTF